MSRTPSPRRGPLVRPVAAAATCLVLLAAAVACGEDDQSQAFPNPRDSSAPTDPTATSAPPSPTVAPAAGPRVDLPVFSVRIPRGWEFLELTELTYAVEDRRSRDAVYLGVLPDWEPGSTAKLARDFLRGGTSYSVEPRPRPDVVLDGEPAFHLAAEQDYDVLDVYGAWWDGHLVTARFLLDDDTPAAERRELIESVLVTWEWK